MSRVPLFTLPAFREAALRQNLRAAAEALSLTPSAVSQQIRLLEDQLGFAVFDRRGRSLVLNAAGQRLQASAVQALELLDEGVAAARRTARGEHQVLRLTVLPSFAQRWLLPRMGRWRQQHPTITLDIHASQALVDLRREHFHAGLRVGQGQWRGLVSERVLDSPLVAVAAPARALRLTEGDHRALAAEPLLGGDEVWSRFLALCGCRLQGRTVAEFNDAGLMLQAAEQDLGIALAREVLAADALAAGRLVRVSPHTLHDPDDGGYWLAYPPEHAQWAPLLALRQWLHDEVALALKPAPAPAAAAPRSGRAAAGASPAAAAGRSRSRSPR